VAGIAPGSLIDLHNFVAGVDRLTEEDLVEGVDIDVTRRSLPFDLRLAASNVESELILAVKLLDVAGEIHVDILQCAETQGGTSTNGVAKSCPVPKTY
jgi:hypothetical protein